MERMRRAGWSWISLDVAIPFYEEIEIPRVSYLRPRRKSDPPFPRHVTIPLSDRGGDSFSECKWRDLINRVVQEIQKISVSILASLLFFVFLRTSTASGSGTVSSTKNMAGVGPITQDWEPVVIRKKAPNAATKKDEKAVNAARRSGAEIETLRKGMSTSQTRLFLPLFSLVPLFSSSLSSSFSSFCFCIGIFYLSFSFGLFLSPIYYSQGIVELTKYFCRQWGSCCLVGIEVIFLK